ncbi:MAG: XRE family transcriptional regulator [Betaproteobacteria bacterium]|nr:MAG: XRE family transcriptional regulator [Betaproteobacteria bacterium]
MPTRSISPAARAGSSIAVVKTHPNRRLTITAPDYHWLATTSFSARLIALRKQRAMTQQSLAETAGIHVQQIKRYEAGTSQPTAEALKKLALTLHVSTDALLFEEAERGPEDALRLQFEAIAKMPSREKQIIQELIDGMILKYEASRWASRTSS